MGKAKTPSKDNLPGTKLRTIIIIKLTRFHIPLKFYIYIYIPQFSDLMNDWEIGGTQNKWVCPSDRHLQLRAQ